MASIIFGPIVSRRFGKSLGIDLSPYKKQCNFDCIYCELSPSKAIDSYSDIVPVDDIISAISSALKEYKDIDVLTITANGEPTLYPYLKELVIELNKIKGNTKTLILTNSSTISNPKIQNILKYFDIVKLSLDCATSRCFKKIDRPEHSISLEDIKRGIKEFASNYKGELIIEILVVAGINDNCDEMKGINRFLKEIKIKRVDLGTIDRPPAYDVKPVDYKKLRELSLCFDPVIPIHITSRKDIHKVPSSAYTKDEIVSTIEKRPLTPDDVDILFDEESKKRLQELISQEEIEETENHGVKFYKIFRKNS